MKKGSNEWWVSLAASFDGHIRSEAESIEEYEELYKTSDDPGIRFLMRLILDDERRHHSLFTQLAGAARRQSGLAPDPRLDAESAALLAEPTRDYLADERRDLDRIAKLRKELSGPEEGMWALILDLLAADTRKHIHILEYIDRCVREAS